MTSPNQQPPSKSIQVGPGDQACVDEGRVADDTDDTVPIVVGCLLAALIAVVMVSYFVIRARANRK